MCDKCKYAKDTGVLWCSSTWSKTRIICQNKEHVQKQKNGVIRGASSLYCRWNNNYELEVKSDVCCRNHCLDFVSED